MVYEIKTSNCGLTSVDRNTFFCKFGVISLTSWLSTEYYILMIIKVYHLIMYSILLLCQFNWYFRYICTLENVQIVKIQACL
jgi:hypothetical protein